jgi:tripartite-type tricarboxylate transporter receptor subunit TctC
MSAFCCRSTRFLTKLKATLHIPATLSLPRVAWALAPLAICLAGIGQASAHDYPSRPVRWTIGFPAGGSTDTLVRIMAEWLQARLGQTVLVENKSGAGSNIATEAVIHAPPTATRWRRSHPPMQSTRRSASGC